MLKVIVDYETQSFNLQEFSLEVTRNKEIAKSSLQNEVGKVQIQKTKKAIRPNVEKVFDNLVNYLAELTADDEQKANDWKPQNHPFLIINVLNIAE